MRRISSTDTRAAGPVADYARLQHLARTDLALAIDLGAAAAREERARHLRDAFRGAGLGLAQLFGLASRPIPDAAGPQPSRR